MKRLTIPLLTIVAATAMACGAAAPTPSPTPAPAAIGFEVDFQTGSIAPPFNYTYTLTGAFDGDALDVTYKLTYLYREGMTEEQLAAQGYSTRDDIDWTGRLTGDAVVAWHTLLLKPPGPIPPMLPGSDSFTVTIRFDGRPDQFGSPTNRNEWEELIDDIDHQARVETGNPRATR